MGRKTLRTPEGWARQAIHRKNYKQALRLIVDAARAEPCYFCGEEDPDVKDFHHIRPEERSFNVSNSWNYYGEKTIRQEIAKCLVVCANCHRRIHVGKLTIPEEM